MTDELLQDIASGITDDDVAKAKESSAAMKDVNAKTDMLQNQMFAVDQGGSETR